MYPAIYFVSTLNFLPDQVAGAGKAYLVAKTLRGNNRNLVAQALVGLKVERELGVVTLDHNLGGPLDGLFFY